MNELTVNEIDMLSDALDALESKELRDHTMGSMMGHMLLGAFGDKNDPETVRFREEKRIEMERERIEIESKQRALKDRIVLIKAKLIYLKDKCSVEGLISSANTKGSETSIR